MRLTSFSHWHFVDDNAEVRGAPANMAIDHALLESVQEGSAPILRFYRWRVPTLSLGRNQPALGIYHRAEGQELVRRPTGGLAVLHAREITYGIALPAALLGGPRATYIAINRALVAGLRDLGIAAEVANARKRAAFGTIQPCFAEAAEGEVIAHGRKLVGSAQRYQRGAILQHGSILLGNDQPSGAISMADLLPEVPAVPKIVDALKAAFEHVCGTCLAPAVLSPQQQERAARFEELYASDGWTWRK